MTQRDMFRADAPLPAPELVARAGNPYDLIRPPFNEADEWDRMVYVIRARDRLRKLGVTDGEVVPGAVPMYRSRSNPNVETPL